MIGKQRAIDSLVRRLEWAANNGTGPVIHAGDVPLLLSLATDAARYRWIADRDRERFVSVRIDFGPLDQKTRSAKYRQHRVCWYDDEQGWIDTAGDGLDAAIDAAMQSSDVPSDANQGEKQ
jgi:hypothetical protein